MKVNCECYTETVKEVGVGQCQHLIHHPVSQQINAAVNGQNSILQATVNDTKKMAGTRQRNKLPL